MIIKVTLILFQHLVKMKSGYVYIMTNTNRTTFYIGVTSNLKKRVTEHIEGLGSNFTKKYNLKDLIYFEEFQDIERAIQREKQLKNWHREWKISLVQKKNPNLETLEI
ncbi:MAG: GIY-YIG nuclease family protein [Bacteroidota bacterium]